MSEQQLSAAGKAPRPSLPWHQCMLVLVEVFPEQSCSLGALRVVFYLLGAVPDRGDPTLLSLLSWGCRMSCQGAKPGNVCLCLVEIGEVIPFTEWFHDQQIQCQTWTCMAGAEDEAVFGQPVLTASEAQMKPRLALQNSSQNHSPLLVLSVQTLQQMEAFSNQGCWFV